ncbi:MAG: hypothetical protein C0401_11580, partial [Anaerolinea sp.]|nr:hypothetical protein [Anaerolinea sp.]
MENEIEERSSLESTLEYAQLLWHWAWLLVLAALIAGAAAYFITDQQPRVYESSTLVMVKGASGSSLDNYSSLSQSQQLATTYSNMMLTNPVLDAVFESLGIPVSAKEITVQPVTNTALLKITVMDYDPERAALIANTLVTVFSEQVLLDQTSRYAELKASLEEELTNLNTQIETTQQKLTTLLANPNAGTDPALLLARSQYETALSQYQQSRSYFVQSYQQIKLAEVQSTSSVIQKDPAIPNNIPIQPQPMRSAMLAAIVGFMLAAGTIFLIGFFEDTIRDPEEITRKWGVPVLGLIINYNSTQNTIITMSQPRAPVSEAYRSLRTNLQFAGVNTPLHTLLVTSASPEDGKTSVVANLANVLAQNEREVVAIDADLRRPRIHKVFQLSNRIGLSDYFIRSQDRLIGVVKKTNTKGLCVITSGSLPPNPSELLSSDKMMEVINLLGKHFNTIILDTPPLLAVTDALVLAPRMDGVILVMDPNKTKRGALKHAIEQLRIVNANLLGVVLNNVKVKRSQYYYNHKYYYGKQYGK